MKLKQNRKYLASLVLAAAMLPVAGHADDITDSIEEALKYYKDGEHADAVDSLNYAMQLIKEKKAEGLSSLFPEPLEGWKVMDSSAEATPAAMFGGGVSANQVYKKDDSKITINMITDSPMLQGMMMMFSNPMFATQDGGKLRKINGEKAIVKYKKNRKEGEIVIIVDNRIMVKIEGDNVSLDDLMAYAKAIDYKKLEDA